MLAVRACHGAGGRIDPDTFLQITERKAYSPRTFGPTTIDDRVLNCGFDHSNEFCQSVLRC